MNMKKKDRPLGAMKEANPVRSGLRGRTRLAAVLGLLALPIHSIASVDRPVQDPMAESGSETSDSVDLSKLIQDAKFITEVRNQCKDSGTKVCELAKS
jgi:hypothetical protein